MPEMGGVEATKKIRMLEKYIGLKARIIGLTGGKNRMPKKF
jgi:hypothetical protein